jgi:hypothetical protein
MAAAIVDCSAARPSRRQDDKTVLVNPSRRDRSDIARLTEAMPGNRRPFRLCEFLPISQLNESAIIHMIDTGLRDRR